MSKITLLLFPNQILDLPILKKIIKDYNINEIIFIEHPIYFGFKYNAKNINSTKKYNFNKLKIIYNLSINLYYKDLLKKLKIKINFITLKKYDNNILKLVNLNKSNNDKVKSFIFLDTMNIEFNKIITKSISDIKMLNTPIILTSLDELKEYHKNNKNKTQTHSAFYKWQKSRLNILKDINKTYDQQNKLDDNLKIKLGSRILSKDKKYLLAGIKLYYKDYDTVFKNNPSILNADKITLSNFNFPVTHKGASKCFLNFLKNHFDNFGKYQDSIMNTDNKENLLLFHSGISPMLNLGLILPLEIINKLKKNNKYRKQNLAAYESFVRQIIGWREYQYYIYNFFKTKQEKLNYFNNKNKITNSFYYATTGITPVDNCIKQAFNYGYIHHILRLMVLCNFMNLCMIKPNDIFNWFMEFSLDSYEWLMYCNVYSMGIWSDGGLAMRKPYIASNNYILKMSNYNSKDDWNKLWYNLFYNFVSEKNKELSKTYYAGLIKHWKNKKETEKKEIKDTVNKFMKNKFQFKKE